MLVIPKPELMRVRLTQALIYEIASFDAYFTVEELPAFFKHHAKDVTHAATICEYLAYLRELFLRTHRLNEWDVQYCFYTNRATTLVMKIYTRYHSEQLNEVMWVFDLCE